MIFIPSIFVILSCLLVGACSDLASGSKKSLSGTKKDIDAEANPPGNEVAGCPKYPLVFLHGFMGGNRIGNFAGVTKHFGSKGCKVLVAEVSPVNGIEFRGRQFAEQVSKFIQSTGLSKVNIVAHSQGGLDARYAISSLNLGTSVASLSMLSTPNLGTPVADFALNNASDPISQTLVSALLSMMSSVSNSQSMSSNNAQAAIKSLSTSYLIDTFNPATKDVTGVYYQSWGARSGQGTSDRIKMTLALTQPIITSKAGENDGVVPVSSAKWGEFRGTLDADHLDLVGLKLEDASQSKFDHLKFLDELAKELASKGF